MLEIIQFSKQYKNDQKAVDNLSLEVSSGDVFGFIGHNGAGKSTTIKAIVGILDFTQGEIFIDGYSIKKEPVECKRRMAYLPDNPDIYEQLTGIQYLNFISDIYEVSKDKREKRIKLYAGIFEIESVLDNAISSYSHGMKQKLSLISAFVHRPKLLVLDEPFVGLDPKASLTLRKELSNICEEGSAVFFSTHSLDIAEKMCNKIAMIHKGKLAISGNVQELTKEKSLEDQFMLVIEND